MIFVYGASYSGKEEYVKKRFGAGTEIIRDVHLLVREMMLCGKDPVAEMTKLLSEHKNAVFITDETGCGIVPAGRFERDWRETAGRINCMIAEKAGKVIRVVCGIGTEIK